MPPVSAVGRNLRAAAPSSGQLACQAALTDIRARAARGEPCAVVFDIDNTVADTRARTLAIAKAFDRVGGTSHFEKLTLGRVGLDGRDTCRRLGLPAAVAERFASHWEREFWSGANFGSDAPIAKTVALAKAAKAAGAQVLYLTGRVEGLRAATREQLVRLGLPDAADANLFCKPSLEVRTAPFKAELLEAWMQRGTHIGWFLTEGRRDIAHLQQALPKVPCVLLHSPLERGAEALRADTPVLR